MWAPILYREHTYIVSIVVPFFGLPKSLLKDPNDKSG